MIKDGNKFNGKNLDHIIPINDTCKGTHTMNNVRILCRICNQTRPKDGSDIIKNSLSS